MDANHPGEQGPVRYEVRYEGWSQRHGSTREDLVVFLGVWKERRPVSSAVAQLSAPVAATLEEALPRERVVGGLASVAAQVVEHHVRRLGREGAMPPQISMRLDRYTDRITADGGDAVGRMTGHGSVLRAFEV